MQVKNINQNNGKALSKQLICIDACGKVYLYISRVVSSSFKYCIQGTVIGKGTVTECTECWPCPLFDILFNEYFRAASLVVGRRPQCSGPPQQRMYSTLPIHWNIKSAPASPGRSRAGPSLYVFSLLGYSYTEQRLHIKSSSYLRPPPPPQFPSGSGKLLVPIGENLHRIPIHHRYHLRSLPGLTSHP